MKKFLGFLDSFLRSLSILAITIIILIGGFLIYYFVTISVYEKRGEEYKPPITLYNIISRSMLPGLDVYDVIVDGKVQSINDIKKEDVITYISKSPDNYNYIVTHRVIEIKDTEYGKALITKGDNNKIADEAPVYEDQILGKMLFKIPKLGKLQIFLGYKGGWLFVILIPALGVMVYDVVKIISIKIIKAKNLKKIKKRR